jgi:hypothetical protein
MGTACHRRPSLSTLRYRSAFLPQFRVDGHPALHIGSRVHLDMLQANQAEAAESAPHLLMRQNDRVEVNLQRCEENIRTESEHGLSPFLYRQYAQYPQNRPQ